VAPINMVLMSILTFALTMVPQRLCLVHQELDLLLEQLPRLIAANGVAAQTLITKCVKVMLVKNFCCIETQTRMTPCANTILGTFSVHS
jgi:hypothetical protein